MTTETLDLALSVKRGERRFKDIAEDKRGEVVRAMQILSDVQFAKLAEAQEHKIAPSTFAIPQRLRRARST